MSVFTTFTSFSRLDGTAKYHLDAPLLWRIGAKHSEWELVIPAGTIFDITIPCYARLFLSPHDPKILPAAAVHDELLKRGFDPAFAAAEFRRAARARGCSPFWGWVLFISTLLWTA